MCRLSLTAFLFIALAALTLTAAIAATTADQALLDNVQAFIDRIMARGKVATKFTPVLKLISPDGTMDVFEIDGDAATGRVILRGSSGPALTAAVGRYFKYYLKCDIYWQNGGGYQFAAFPLGQLPIPEELERIVFMSERRYYQNTCTASYTFAWRDWTSYEQEIDWMAFEGINLPLAFTGQEYIWAALYQEKYGVSEAGLAQFFTGPGFLAWNRMSNMRAFAGPLPQSWMSQQFALQTNILKRYQELGIQPVLPAFNGVVPEEMVALYPNANITRLTHAWCDFPTQYCCPYIVSSTDPLFIEIGAAFLTLQREKYGALVADVHTYNSDTFNENTPNSNASEYLASSSAAVFQSMRAADPDATWLMQAWLFVENPTFWTDDAIAAYLGGVPDDGMLLLDLTSDEVPMWSKIAANGKRFIWCLLHNYGGSRALYGNLTMLSSAPLATMQATPKLFSGTGLTMEAIDQNPVVYAFMNEVGMYGSQPGNPLQQTKDWTADYVERRYGLALSSVTDEQREAAAAAWSVLLPTCYLGYTGCWHPTCPRRSIITTRPLLNLTQETVQEAGPLVDAWESLQKVNRSSLGAFRYDLVDVGRQVVSNLFFDLYSLAQAAFARRDAKSFSALADRMTALIADWDSLLLTHEAFLFGAWIRDARSWGLDGTSGEQDADLYEFNARNQVTLWGPKAVDLPTVWGLNNDYAAKNWAGLVSGYYLPRWRLFLSFAAKALDANAEFPQTAYTDAEMALGETFTHDTKTQFSADPVGDTCATSSRLQGRYGNAYRSPSTYMALPDTATVAAVQLLQKKAWTSNLAQLRFLCDAEPACLAYSSAGIFSASAAAADLTSVPGVTLYMKQI